MKNLKVLGLALVAMLTMAVTAASASATEFHSEASETTVTGSQVTVNTFTTNSGTIHCSVATFTGTQVGSTASSIEVSPHYTGCESTGWIEAEVEVDMNGCKYNMTANGEVHLKCSGTNTIAVTAPFCTITIAPQTLKSVSYTNSGSGAGREITVDANVTGIKYKESGFACNKNGAEPTNGTYEGSVKVKGETSGGTQVGIWW